MAESRVVTERNVNESVSRSNTLIAPLAGTVFFTIATTDLPNGYYRFDTVTGITMVSGAAPAATDLRNFIIDIGTRGDFVAQASPGGSTRTVGWIRLSGNEDIICKVGPNNASNNSFYAMAVFLTKRN
jgi:hypothetical protein